MTTTPPVPLTAKKLGTAIAVITVIAITIILLFYLLSKAEDGQGLIMGNSTQHTIIITDQWSEKISGGVPWRIERDDVAYVVEYNTTKCGVVEETIPSRISRGPGWKPMYPDPEATSVRFKLPSNSKVEKAELLLYH